MVCSPISLYTLEAYIANNMDEDSPPNRVPSFCFHDLLCSGLRGFDKACISDSLYINIAFPFNPLYTNGFFLLVRYNKLWIVHCTYHLVGMSGYNFETNIVFFCLKIFFTLTNSVDPNEMQHKHYAAFHLGLETSLFTKVLV